MLTLAVIAEFTVTVIAFDVAVALSKHGIPFDVITTVTASPLANVELVKVALSVPASFPFTFHWYTGVVPPLVMMLSAKKMFSQKNAALALGALAQVRTPCPLPQCQL